MHDVTFDTKTIDSAREFEASEGGALPRPADVLTIVALSGGLWALLTMAAVALVG